MLARLLFVLGFEKETGAPTISDVLRVAAYRFVHLWPDVIDFLTCPEEEEEFEVIPWVVGKASQKVPPPRQTNHCEPDTESCDDDFSTATLFLWCCLFLCAILLAFHAGIQHSDRPMKQEHDFRLIQMSRCRSVELNMCAGKFAFWGRDLCVSANSPFLLKTCKKMAGLAAKRQIYQHFLHHPGISGKTG